VETRLDEGGQGKKEGGNVLLPSAQSRIQNSLVASVVHCLTTQRDTQRPDAAALSPRTSIERQVSYSHPRRPAKST
jgi:hypothetical protein